MLQGSRPTCTGSLSGEAVGGRRADLDDAAVVELARKALVLLGAQQRHAFFATNCCDDHTERELPLSVKCQSAFLGHLSRHTNYKHMEHEARPFATLDNEV